MKQTPVTDNFNVDLLAMMPAGARRIVEVGCSSGALAREYRRANPQCEYIGIEIDDGCAAIARERCTRVLVGSIEQLPDADFDALAPADCWAFGDVLEHLYDPWAVLRRLRRVATPSTSIVACIPNAQHWSIQLRLNSGMFRYEDTGLLDRTHIRWFTRRTIAELFASTGFRIVEGRGRTFEEPQPGTANWVELVGASANAIAPGKRMLSSMSPTFLASERGVAILGTPGGSRIITMVLLAALQWLDGADAQAMAAAKRFHHQFYPDLVAYEDGAFTPEQLKSLEERGHKLQKDVRPVGNMNVVTWDYATGKVEAVTDPRGAAVGQVY